MANCAEFVAAVVASEQASTLEPILHNTLLPLSFARNACKSYVIDVAAFTVIDFSVFVQPTPSESAFTYTVLIYRVTGKTLTALASVPAVEQYAAFSKEFTQGTYIMCFQTSVAVAFAGTLLAVYRGYQLFSVLSPHFHTGEYMVGTPDNRRPPADCSAVLYYEMVEGSLPPGMRMTGLGQVRGVAPNLDCIEDNKYYPPSQNWSFEHNDGSFHPWGRQWRFKVRVQIEGMPDVWAEEWFCVKVFNNWSIDRDAFLAQAPFQTVVEEVAPTPVELPSLCPTVAVVEEWRPQTIPQICDGDVVRPVFVVEKEVTPCLTCGPEMEEVVDAIAIPFGVSSVNRAYIEQWLEEVRSMPGVEFQRFAARVASSPIYRQYLTGWPVEITEVQRQLVLTTYTNDPNQLFKAWRLEETRKLPWGIDFLGGETLSISMFVKPAFT